MKLTHPRLLERGDTIGVFTPSEPAYVHSPQLFDNGVRNLEKLGFKVKLGRLTAKRAAEGYRSGSGKDRAAEFMELIRDPSVNGLISTIGGDVSSSMVPFLDFAAIRQSRKVICGYSDVTSLHLAILKHAGLRTFYGPGVMTWFGEWPDGVPESTNWFLEAVMTHQKGDRIVTPPARWSNHCRRWETGEWKTIPRQWKPNEGWRVLSAGSATAPIIPVNLNTLMTAAGTSYWPDLDGRLLLIEEMDAPMPREERSLRQLQLMGVFDRIAGLIVGKPEVLHPSDAPFSPDDLLREVVGPRTYPIVCDFDCGHTLPMITVPFEARVRLEAPTTGPATFTFLDPNDA